jgi:hypothetical protein
MNTEKTRAEIGSKDLLDCPFCGVTPTPFDNSTSVWVPHTKDCFLRREAMTIEKQAKWNHRQSNASLTLSGKENSKHE